MKQELHSGNHFDLAASLFGIGAVYDSLGDDKKGLEYFKHVCSIYTTLYGGSYSIVVRISKFIEEFDINFFSRALNIIPSNYQIAFEQGNKVGLEYRKLLLSHSYFNQEIFDIKSLLQKTAIIEGIQELVSKGNCQSTAFSKYLDDVVLKEKFVSLGYKQENIKIPKMLIFEAMNIAIMGAEKKYCVCIEEFMHMQFDLVKDIVEEQPQFFVDGCIVESSIIAMKGDNEWKEYLKQHINYIGMEEAIHNPLSVWNQNYAHDEL
ncbi:TPR repeat-containing protein [Reticulomyxa filosa]|uniref:TPR repeat-containing protein n=1 Tax=Reticulomyxa filosa TaxID=46433 RepID=X6M880_RETFI|nr:TPR repeat-containing protein [Reticulomyxa filosa]|eukprot:ETO10119.1 TPR repeat-containing protein [Reticulomyxa filosa]